jgi:integrase
VRIGKRGFAAPIKGKLRVEFADEQLSSYAGLELVRRYLEERGLRARLSAHSMRGLHSTLAMEAGVTGAVVAASLGHESVSTTTQSYAKPEAVATATQRRALTILGGGRG